MATEEEQKALETRPAPAVMPVFGFMPQVIRNFFAGGSGDGQKEALERLAEMRKGFGGGAVPAAPARF